MSLVFLCYSKKTSGDRISVAFFCESECGVEINFTPAHLHKNEAEPRDVFLRREWHYSLEYGGCGANNIYFQRCPASASPSESAEDNPTHINKKNNPLYIIIASGDSCCRSFFDVSAKKEQ